MDKDSKYNTILNDFKYHSMKLAKLNCHIVFISVCLTLGLCPKGFNIKLPITGLPPSLRSNVNLLGLITSLQLANMVLDSYKILSKQHTDEVKYIHDKLISNFQSPQTLIDINAFFKRVSYFVSDKMNKSFKKLSNLFSESVKSQTDFSLRLKILSNIVSDDSLINCNINDNQSLETRPNNLQFNHNNIENLSNYTPSRHELSVLSKGLTFCPTPRFDQINLVNDALAFARNIRIKHYFSINKPQNDCTIPQCLQQYKEQSVWEPPPLPSNHPVEQFINVVISNLSDPSFEDSLKKSNNLSKDEVKAIKSLKYNKDIIILPADKGDKIVIQNINDYKDEVNRQLSDYDTYKHLTKDPTHQFNDTINDFITKFGPEESLSDKTISILTPKYPRTSTFYTLPKIHKNIRPPPGRPIVASYGCPTERISGYIDDHLQTFVKQLPSYIKNTDDFISKLSNIKQPLAKDIILVTVDVNSLYTNIPHTEGLLAVEHFLNTRPKNSKPSTKFLLQLTKFVLTMNSFRFGDKFYLQLKGTAMGTKMAPSYANLFMAVLEKKFLLSQHYVPLYWLRFIDDIFFIWEHGEELLKMFLDALNSFSSLKYTYQYSRELITFLDVDIFVESGFLKTKLHIKDTCTMQYLSYDSCHPAYIKKSIPKSLAIRGKKLCSKESDFNKYINTLTDRFNSLGYPQKLVKNQIRQQKNTSSSVSKSDPKFVTKYHPGLNKINSIIKTAYPILQTLSETEDIFSKPPRVIFKNAPNLKNILVHTDISNQTNQKEIPTSGCEPCKKPRCGTCKIMDKSKNFQSSTTNKTYPIKGSINCNTSNIIYQLNCSQCEKQYIGQTSNPLRIRMTGHRFSINHKQMEKPIAQHVHEHNEQKLENCFTLKGVQKIKENKNEEINRYNLRRSETAHQLILKTRHPKGLNLR